MRRAATSSCRKIGAIFFSITCAIGWPSDWEIAIFCNNEGEQKRLQEILAEAQIPLEEITFLQRPLLRGFVWPAGKLVVLSDAEIFGRYQTLRALRQQERLVSLRSQHQALDFSEIAGGRLRRASASRHRAL